MEITLAGCRIRLRPAAHEFSQALGKLQCSEGEPPVASIASRDFEPDSRFQNRIDDLVFWPFDRILLSGLDFVFK